MSKFKLLIATGLLLFVGKVGFCYVSEPVLLQTPSGPRDTLPTADYGGVQYSTISFSSANVLCFSGVGSVVGFVSSSGTASTDFLSFSDTWTLIAGSSNGDSPGSAGDDYTTTNEIARVYLSTTGAFNNDAGHLGQTYYFPRPIRVKQGLAVKCSVATYNRITVLGTQLHKAGP